MLRENQIQSHVLPHGCLTAASPDTLHLDIPYSCHQGALWGYFLVEWAEDWPFQLQTLQGGCFGME